MGEAGEGRVGNSVKSSGILSVMLQGPLCPQQWAEKREVVLTPSPGQISALPYLPWLPLSPRKGEEIGVPPQP